MRSVDCPQSEKESPDLVAHIGCVNCLQDEQELPDLAAVYEAYYDRIYRYCYWRLYTREAAEDVSSTVFLRLAERIGDLKVHDTAETGQWLYGTASNAIRAYLRDTRKLDAILADVWRTRKSASSTVSPGDADDPYWAGVYEAMHHLTPAEQDIIALRFFEGLDAGRISELLGLSRVGARVRLHRAIKKLRKHLAASSEQKGGVEHVQGR
jgi:RNA polymerase sigma-70 factor (ECF subfamily)